MPELPAFAVRLKQLREVAGITRYELAKRAGLSKQAVYKIEDGEREPGWDTVVKLARALGVEVSAFDVKPEQPPPAEPPQEPADSPPPSQPPAPSAPRRIRRK